MALIIRKQFPFFSLAKEVPDNPFGIREFELESGKVRPGDYAAQLRMYRGDVNICSKLNASSVADVCEDLRLFKSANKNSDRDESRTRIVEPRLRKQLEKRRIHRKFLKPDGNTIEIVDHRVLDLLCNVNPIMNAFDICEFTNLHLQLTGNSFWYIIKDQLGLPLEIWPLFPQFMRVIPDPKGGVSGYSYKHGIEEIRYDVDEIIHFKITSPLSLFYGIGELMGALEAFLLWEQMIEYEIALFRNMGRPDMVVFLSQAPNKDQRDRLLGEWNNVHKGASKQGKTIFFGSDQVDKIESFGGSPREMSYRDGKKYVREEICAAFRVPVTFLELSSANRASAASADFQFAKHSVEPHVKRYVQKLTEQLLPMYPDGDQMFFSFDEFVPEDREQTREDHKVYVGAGIETPDEARADLELDPHGGNADMLWMPGTMRPINNDDLDDDDAEAVRVLARAEVMARSRYGEQIRGEKDEAKTPNDGSD